MLRNVSLTTLVGGDPRVVEAHERAVEVALAELERHAQAWAKGGAHRGGCPARGCDLGVTGKLQSS